MDKKTLSARELYIAPRCTVIPMEETAFICTTMVPNGSESRLDDYDTSETELDGGEAGVDL